MCTRNSSFLSHNFIQTTTIRTKYFFTVQLFPSLTFSLSLVSVLADTFAILIVACYFGEYQFLLIAPDKETQSPWPIVRGEHPASIFYEGKSSSTNSYNIELDYVQLFHRPLTDFLTAICTLFATYTVFEITYGKLEMTLSFIDCLLRDNVHSSTRSPQVLELINELNSMKNM